MRARLLSLGIVAALAACGLSNTATNPYDPNSPTQVQARATLTGSVTVEPPETGPADASGVTVSLEGANVTAVTGPSGTFTLTDVPAGTYVMSLSKPAYDTVTTQPINVPLWDSTEPSVNLGTFSLSLSRGAVAGTAALEGETDSTGITVTVQGTSHVALTNSAGAYLISSIPIGTYTLTFQKAAFNDATLPTVVVADNATTDAPAVVLPSDPGTISGTVILQGQTYAGGVNVTAQGTTLDGYANTQMTTTDQTGKYTLSITAGIYNVSFAVMGFKTQQVATAVAPAAPVTLATVTLSPATGEILGVAELDGGMSNAGILVVLTAAETQIPDAGSGDGGADDAGAANGGGTGAGMPDAGTTEDAGVDAGSFDAGTPDDAGIDAGQPDAGDGGIDAGQPDAGDAGTGDGGTADGGSLAGPGTVVATVLTSADGTYEFQNVPVGEYTLTFSANYYHTVSITGLTLTENDILMLPTTRLYSQPADITGTVLLEDRPGGDLSGTQVAVQGTSNVAYTAPDGTFTLSSVGLGPQIVAFTRSGYVEDDVYVSTTPGEQVNLPPVTLDVARGSVGGTITAEELTNYSGIIVSLTGGIAGDSYSTVTDPTGAFVLSDVRVGTYSLVASLANYQTYTSPTFQVTANQTSPYAATPAELTLLRISGLNGVVTAGSGSTQTGTTVLLSGSDVNGVTVTQSTSSQTDGSYSLTGLAPGSYALAFTHPGYNAAALPPTSLSAGQIVTLPPVSLSLSEGGLTGTILLAEQTDNSGTLVSLSTGQATITATDGTYSFPSLPAGTYNITASHTAYVTTTLPPQTVPANGSITAPTTTLAIDTGGSVSGSVALAGATTFGGVTVALTGADVNGVAVTLSAVTADDGTYNITGVPAGSYSITMSMTGYANQTIPGLSLEAEQMVTEPTVTLAISTGGISGVILAQGLTDSSGTIVAVDGTSLSAVTASDGSFSIGGIAVGAYTLTATRTGFNSYTSPTFTMTLNAALTVPAMPVTLTLAANASISGQVLLETGASPLGVEATLNGTLITSATITAQTTTAAADGTFSFMNVSPGTYTVSLAETGFVTSSLPPVSVTAGSSVTLAPFVLPLALGTITGTVTATGAASNAGSLVQLATTSFVALTSGTGSFSMTGVPGGTYTAIASRAGYVSANVPVTLAPGGTFAFPATTLVLDTSATIAGTCTAAGAATLSNSGISLAGNDINGATVTASAMTAADGSFTLRTLPGGTYVVTCTRTGFGSVSSGQITLNAGQQYTGVGLSLSAPTGNVSGTVALSAGVIPGFTPESNLSGITVVLSGSSTDLPQPLVAETTAAGSFSFVSAPVSQSASAYTVTVSKPGYETATGSVTVVLGQTVTVSTLTLTALPSTLIGTVTVPPPATSAAGFTPTLDGTAFNGSSYGPRSADGPTGMDGGYQFSNVPSGNYTVSLTTTAYNTASGTVSVPIPSMSDPTIAGPTLALSVATGGLAGQVVTSANGSGLTVSGDVAGVTVVVTGTGLTTGLVTTTDSGGNWVFSAIPVGTSGSYTITASKPDYASATTTAMVTAGATTTAPELTLAANVYGLSGTLTVTGATDNSGVTGTLTGSAFNGTSYTKSSDSASTAAGAITFSSIPAGTYTVTFTKNSSYTPLVISPVAVAAPPAMLPSLSGTLQRAVGSFTGTVATSAGSTGMTLLASDASSVTVGVTDPSLTQTYSALTGSSGGYAITGIPAPLAAGASYTVSASKPNFATTSTTAVITPGSTPSPVSTLTISPVTSTLNGCVVVPPPATNSTGVTASLTGVAFNGTAFTASATGPSSGTTCGGASGAAYSFSNVPNGTFTVTLSRTGYASATVPGIAVQGATVSLPSTTLTRSTGSITGTVLASDGGAGLSVSAGLALVTLTGADLLGVSYEASTNSAGAYSFTGVPVSPTGAAYTITVTQANFTASGTTTVVVPAGSSIAASTITLTLNNGSVTGSVSVPAPATSSGGVSASLTGSAFNGASWTSPTVTSSSMGGFSFATVPPGTYTLTLSLSGMTPIFVSGVEVAAGTPTTVPAQTMIRAPGGLAGQVAWSANGTGITESTSDLLGVSITITGTGLSGSYDASTDANGNWTVASIPAPLTSGVTYTVTASKAGFTTTSTTATIVAGMTTAVSALTMAVASYNLTGTVTVTSAADNSGVTATLAGVAFNGTTYTKTSSPSAASGAFSITAVPAGTYQVTLAGSASYAPLTIPDVVVAAPPATLPTLTGTLQRATGSFAGLVATSAGSTGMTLLPTDASGVTVGVTDPSLTLTYAAVTNSSGSYTITGIPAPIVAGASYTVSAGKTNFSTATTTAVLTAGTSASPVSELTISPVVSTLSGCVVVPAPAANSTGVTASLSGVAFNGTVYTASATGPSSGTTCGGVSGAAYAFSNVPNGTYTVTLTRTGYASATVTGVTVDGAAVALPSTTMTRSTGSITGTVLASDGGAGLTVSPASALVSLTGSDLLGGVYQATTNSAGGYSFAGVPVSPTGAAYTITVTQPNFIASGTTTVVVPAGSSIAASSITLTLNNGSVTGTVSVPAPATSSGGVSASLTGTAFTGAAWTSPTATSSSTGAFAFATVPPGTYTLTLTLAGMTPIVVTGVAVSAGAATTVPAQTMSRAPGALTGQVAWSANGTGVTESASDLLGVTITVTGTGLTGSYDTSTDVNGNWTVSNIPAPLTGGVTYTVTASKTGFTTTSTTAAVVAGSTTTVSELTMNVASYNLTGTVTVVGAADNSGVTATLAGVAFNGTTYSKASSPSVASGSFSITAVPAGTYSVTLAGNASYAPVTISNVIVAAPPASLPTLTGTLQRATGSFSGTVATSAGSTGMTLLGTDVSGVTVSVTDPSLSSTYSAATTSSGGYTVSSIPAPITVGAAYTVSASKPNFATASTTAVLTPGSSSSAVATITISPVVSTVSGCVVVPPPAANSTGVTASLTGVAFNGTTYTASATGPSSGTTCGGAAGAAYSFSNIPNGTYTISLTRTGYAVASIPGIVVAGSPVTAASATLARNTGSITGTVLASDGGAGLAVSPASALVSLSGSDLLGGVYQATTNSAGAYSFAGVPVSPTGAAYTITVTQPNFTASGTTTVVVPASSSIAASSITLTLNNGSVSGAVVVPSPPAASSAGVSASLAGTAFTGAEWTSPTVTSNSSGVYSFATVPPGTYTLTLSINGMATLQVPSIAVTAGAATTVPTQTMSRATGGLSGQVAWNANGTGLTEGASDLLGVTIAVTGTGLSASYGASTDSNGNWNLSSIPAPLTPGVTYTVTASKAGYTTVSTTQAVVAGTTSTVATLTMNVAAFSLSGTVTVTGAANNAGVTATLAGVAFNGTTYSVGSTAPSTSTGAFSITGVPSGTYSVTLTGNSSYAPLTLPNIIVAAPPAVLPTLNGTLTRATGGFSGTIAVAAGSSGVTVTPSNAAGATVTVTDPSFGGTSYFAVANGSGGFTVTGVPAPIVPGTPYTITVTETGFATTTVSNSTTILNPAIPLTSVGTVTLTAASFSISGTVTLTSPATTASGTVVTLSGTAFNGTPFAATASGSASSLVYSYSFGAVPASSGVYTISASATGFATGTLVTAVTSSNVTGLTLVLGARSTGTVTGQVAVSNGGTGMTISGTDNAGIIVTMTGTGLGSGLTTTTDSTASFTFQNVPTTISGTYSVNVSKSASWVAGSPASVSVSAGATSTVTGLTLTVNAGSLPVIAELQDFENRLPVNTPTFTTIPVTLTGTAFNGDAWGPVTISSSAANGTLTFSALPPGTYAVSAALSQHTSASAAGITVPPGGPATTPTLVLKDTAPPTAPVISLSHKSPTSAFTVQVQLVQASTDPTLPVSNFDNYLITVCTSGSCIPAVPWNGTAADPDSIVNLGEGADNYISVVAQDWDGNQSASTTLVIHRESEPPTAPVNVHIDNRPGSVRISWPAVNQTTSLPIAGYKIYYGPQDGAASTYVGTAASEGSSPIVVGNVTQFNLTGLNNKSPFYVAVTAYDGVVDPGPNESALSTGQLANPNTAPFDRAVHQGIGQGANSMAVFRDDVIISTGVGPSSTVSQSAEASTLAPLEGSFTVSSYNYQQYFGLTNHFNSITSPRARKLVADGNRVVYAFDPGDPAPGLGGIPGQPGLDIIDTWNPGVADALSVAYSDVESSWYFQQIVPAHRAGIGAGSQTTHLYATIEAGSTYYIVTFSQLSDHIGIAYDGLFIPLHNNNQPLDMQSAGNYIFVSTVNSIDAYVVAPDFSSIAYEGSATLDTIQASTGRAMAINWPYIYFIDEGGSTLSEITAYNGLTYYQPYTTCTTNTQCEQTPQETCSSGYCVWANGISLSGPETISELTGNGYKLAIAGDQLLVEEHELWYQTAVQSFSLSNPSLPPLSGTYELNTPAELGWAADARDIAVSGSTAWVLTLSTGAGNGLPLLYSTLDVVEMGGPRSIVRQNSFVGESDDATPQTLTEVVGVRTRGSRAIAMAYDPIGGYVVEDVDMTTGFNSQTDNYVTAAETYSYPSSSPTGVVGPWCNNSFFSCVPMAVAGDYAYVDVEISPEFETVHNIYVYDLSIPSKVAGATPIGTIHPTNYPTGIAVANDYVYVSETADTGSPTTTWLERFDITNLASPAAPIHPLQAANQGYSVDVFGAYAYVGTDTGYCEVDLTNAASFTGLTPKCYTASGQSQASIFSDSERQFTGNGDTVALQNYTTPSVVSATYTGPTSFPTMGFVVNGPNLYGSFASIATGNEGSVLAGYDLSSGSLIPLDTDPFIIDAASAPPAIAGSLIVVPDSGGGLVLERIY